MLGSMRSVNEEIWNTKNTHFLSSYDSVKRKNIYCICTVGNIFVEIFMFLLNTVTDIKKSEHLYLLSMKSVPLLNWMNQSMLISGGIANGLSFTVMTIVSYINIC